MLSIQIPLPGTIEAPIRRTFFRATMLVLAMFGASCAGDVPATGQSGQALTAAQCDYFALNGTTRVCHATGSTRNPYVVINVAAAACVDAHARHPHDFIAANDPTCSGHGCLAANAPCDATLGCCSGLTCRSGTCQPVDRCLGVVCTASGPCDYATCDPATGACVHEATTGNPCDDGNMCTRSDTCQAGVCTGAEPVVCPPSDECHLGGTCDPTSGACSNPAAGNGTACNDGNACTSGDVCTAGACTGSPVAVDDGNDCTADSCDSRSGAVHTLVADGTACNDSNACTQVDTCVAGVCVGASPVVCTASDACHLAGTCAPANGVCSNPPVAGAPPSCPASWPCLGTCSGPPLARSGNECLSASEASNFSYMQQLAAMNGTTCPSGQPIVGFLLYNGGWGCIRTATYYCSL